MNKFQLALEIKELYLNKKMSVSSIASMLNFSENKVNYWLKKEEVKKRSISEAIYLKHNPKGDPFHFTKPKNIEEAILFGLGIGLYWGEGNKANKSAVRLGNSDVNLLKLFIKFLVKFFHIKKDDLRFHLHIFSDCDVQKCLDFWGRELNIRKGQFYKPHVTKTGKLGTYRKKSENGVVTVYYCNKKLRDLLIKILPM